jgi:cyclic pyranopterin phosphate synthase
MPRELFGADHVFLPRPNLLSFEEIARVARIACTLGVKKIRLTGGEPLLRRQIETLVADLAEIPHLELTLTTNGSLLAKKAQALKDAGLTRITVSLDALDDPTFKRMNDADFSVAQVLAGIETAQRVGFADIKVNAVIQRGVNEHALLDLARHFRGTGIILRFIEFMDVGASNGWQLTDVIMAADMRQQLAREWPLQPLSAQYAGEVASRYAYQDGAGEVGFISSVSAPFCGHCSRLRLSTDGQLFTCLFASLGFDLKTLLRTGCDDDVIADALQQLWRLRRDRYSELRSAHTQGLRKIEMSYIGG